MGRTCSTYGRNEKFVQNFGEKTWREETTQKNLGVDRRIVLDWVLGK
jgi:hypothetical protein